MEAAATEIQFKLPIAQTKLEKVSPESWFSQNSGCFVIWPKFVDSCKHGDLPRRSQLFMWRFKSQYRLYSYWRKLTTFVWKTKNESEPLEIYFLNFQKDSQEFNSIIKPWSYIPKLVYVHFRLYVGKRYTCGFGVAREFISVQASL